MPETDLSNLRRGGKDPRLVCFGALFQGEFYTAAIWTRPTARMFNGKPYLELRRYAIAPTAPHNTASRGLRIMAMLIGRLMSDIERLISSQDLEQHTGTIYKAAGWEIDTNNRGKPAVNKQGEWNRPSRARKPAQSAHPKIRWKKDI